MAEDFTIGFFSLLAKDEDLFEAGVAVLFEESSVTDGSAVASFG